MPLLSRPFFSFKKCPDDPLVRTSADWSPPEKTIVVAGAPRSGSSLLCALIGATGSLGDPDEFFKERLPKYPDPSGRDDIQHRLRLVRSRASANGVCSFKIFPDQLRYATRSVEDFWAFFPDPLFVRVSRKDLLGQAISWAKAKQTQQWSSRQPALGAAAYSAPSIERALRRLVEHNGRWDRYFARNGIAPVEIRYEALLEAPCAALKTVASRAGVTLQYVPALCDVSLGRQSDDTNDDWRRRFLAEAGDMNGMD